MANLLALFASPRGDRSYSTTVAAAFLDAHAAAKPDVHIHRKSLFDEPLMPFDGFALQAKYRVLHGESHSPEEADAWNDVAALARQFRDADRIVIASPMWNFSIPYRLKQYLDVIVQPGLTFEVTPEGNYRGLCRAKALLILARGGAYPAGTPAEAWDHQTGYLRFILGFVGVSEVEVIHVEPTLAGADAATRSRDAALAAARELAPRF